MFVYGQFGLSLPHNEAGQLASGPSVESDDLQPGDVLAFENTYRRGLSHVGIYLGGGRFVHAGDEAHGVLVDDLWDGYWGPRFAGASRPTRWGRASPRAEDAPAYALRTSSAELTICRLSLPTSVRTCDSRSGVWRTRMSVPASSI
jgi:hypothetical protein